MTGITTHVLDTILGAGAAFMRVELVLPDGSSMATALDANGRATLLEVLSTPGAYELRFYARDYGVTQFYDIIPVRFAVDDTSKHYHIPLILAAYGYSTYRGG